MMADTTPERVQAIAKHLKKVNPADLLIYIEDAKDEITALNVPAQYEERLQRYLAAHLATINMPRPTSKKASDLSLSYNRPQGTGLDSTEYGQEYRRLLRQARGGVLAVM